MQVLTGDTQICGEECAIDALTCTSQACGHTVMVINLSSLSVSLLPLSPYTSVSLCTLQACEEERRLADSQEAFKTCIEEHGRGHRLMLFAHFTGVWRRAHNHCHDRERSVRVRVRRARPARCGDFGHLSETSAHSWADSCASYSNGV